VIYTTNSVESLHASLQKVLNPKKALPNDEAILKVLYLAIHRVAEKWTMPIRDWKVALNQFMILFGSERLGVKLPVTQNSEKSRNTAVNSFAIKQQRCVPG
jgi:putative transposase